jgi:hypothetical protein
MAIAPKPKPTPERNAGARTERAAIVKEIRERIATGGTLVSLLAWVRARAKRTAKHPGGVGRR